MLETQMKSNGSTKVPISTRVKEELREFVVVATYLFICFTAVAYLKASILKAHGIAFAPFAFAAIKALICAKFVSVGRVFQVGERFKSLPLIWPILYKSLSFLALLLVLNAVEEVVVGLIHSRRVIDSLSEVGGGTLDQLTATSVVGLLILIPLFAFRALGEVVGEGNLVRIFLEQRRETQGSTASGNRAR
jgi:hypothetical protein